MAVAQVEDHPAWVEVLPPEPHGLLTAGLHLRKNDRCEEDAGALSCRGHNDHTCGIPPLPIKA